MPLSTRRLAAASCLAAVAACHAAPRPPAVAPAAPPLAEQYCWWTSLRTPLPPDSVGARFAAAFARLGFGAAAVEARRDTTVRDEATRTDEAVARAVVVHAPRSVLPGDGATDTTPALHSEGLAIAWVRADTTRVRYYLAHDRELPGGEAIGRCTTLWRAAMGTGDAPPR